MSMKTIPLTEAHAALLEQRGLSLETVHQLGWQTCAERKGDWIAIPFLRAGKQVNTKYRRIVKSEDGFNFEQDKDGEQCFYNLAAIEDIGKLSSEEQRRQSIVITEGEFDCAVALQAGYLAVSVPSGAPAKAVEHEDSVKFDFLKDFPKYAIATLAVDDDHAGHVLRQELALRLGWHRCKWAQYPKGCKDLGDVAKKYGAAGVRKVLGEKTKFMNAGGLFRLSELPELPELPAYENGIGNVSDMAKMRLGDFTVVSGIWSMGKTLFTNVWACNMVKNHGFKVCFASFEQNPRGDHLRFLRTTHIGRARYASGFPEWSGAEIAGADAWIEKNFTFIMPDDENDEMANLKWLLVRLRAAIIQHGANLLIIDPWNEIDHDRPQGMSLTEYTGFAIKQFKRLARQHMVHIIVVAHPAKMEKNRDGEYPIPSLYDISDSAHWANKSDLGIIIHRLPDADKKRHVTLVRIAKVRYWGVIGMIGDKTLEYLPESCTYIDAPDFQAKGQKNKITTESETKKKPSDKVKPTIPYKD